MLALIAIAALVARARHAMLLVWLFNIEGTPRGHPIASQTAIGCIPTQPGVARILPPAAALIVCAAAAQAGMIGASGHY